MCIRFGYAIDSDYAGPYAGIVLLLYDYCRSTGLGDWRESLLKVEEQFGPKEWPEAAVVGKR